MLRHGNGSRCRHAEQGARESGGSWRVAGAGDTQVGGASHWERRWGAGETRGIQLGTAAGGEAVGKTGGGNKRSRNDRIKGGAEGIDKVQC